MEDLVLKRCSIKMSKTYALLFLVILYLPICICLAPVNALLTLGPFLTVVFVRA